MGSLGTLIKFSCDVIAACVASALGLMWVQSSGLPMPPLWMMTFYAPTVIALAALRQNYRRTLSWTYLEEFVSVQTTAALGAMLLLSGMVLTGVTGELGQSVARVWMVTALLLPIGRWTALAGKRRLRKHQYLQSPTLILGNGAVAGELARRFINSPEYGVLPVGLVDADPPWHSSQAGARTDDYSIPVVGTPDTIVEAIKQTGAEAVVVAFSRTRDRELTRAIRLSRLAGLKIWVVPRMFDTVGKRARVDYVGALPLLVLSSTSPKGWQFATKHISDRVVGFVFLTLLSPLFLVLMAAVRLSSPGPVFYRQPRVGRDGVVFDCLKFRSMVDGTESETGSEPTEDRAPGGVEGEVDRRTRIGKIMRATSLDELPQLINVVRGEMSLIGPRPERPEFVDVFNAQVRLYGERHRVKAGMTGWAQVHGLRGQTSIQDRAEWDNYYIENWSLLLDWQILAMTIPALFRRAE
ncbi:MAG: sugar transferase [Actinomycetota bacterium]|nr:sugar transferase [Actinomycetota bacterium]